MAEWRSTATASDFEHLGVTEIANLISHQVERVSTEYPTVETYDQALDALRKVSRVLVLYTVLVRRVLQNMQGVSR